ncbi:hypothetical protein CBR_g17660 [Chara braunii]|uniref:Uncharacterized protein n=1 Tax=Chara braunii TaxID=69332 RepID=A0A388KV53_CHABU|nr:hypothetical protein CBR_g17660 [Chara braunii]|eukprot:GBG73945.1 hypothetical protein CBR_g17660 [Chara braunii]
MEMEAELQHGALRLEDMLFDNDDDVSPAEDAEGGQDDDDVVNYYTTTCAVCENWETESETCCDVAVHESDEHQGGAGEWGVNLMALSYRVEDETAVVDGEREYANDDAGEWDVEWGSLATAATAAATATAKAEANAATVTTTTSTITTITTSTSTEIGVDCEAGEWGEESGLMATTGTSKTKLELWRHRKSLYFRTEAGEQAASMSAVLGNGRSAKIRPFVPTWCNSNGVTPIVGCNEVL